MVPARGPRTLGCVRRLERDVKNPQPSQLGTLHAGALQSTATIAQPEKKRPSSGGATGPLDAH